MTDYPITPPPELALPTSKVSGCRSTNPSPKPMTELSPAAQAILDASTKVFWRPPIDVPAFQSKSVAAALRAAADQVAPLGYEDVWTDGRILQYEKRDPVREKLLAIADELETQ
jgi:hypothetical protein